MIPKKLKQDNNNDCFLNDERHKPALFTSNEYDDNDRFKAEVVKRYNDYPLMRTYCIILGITVISLIFKLWLC